MKYCYFLALLLASLTNLNTAHAGPLDLSKYAGKVVYLDFWASWCGPCKKSFPFMNQIKQQFEEQGLAVIAVNVDIDRENADDFLAKHPAQFEIIYDPDGELMAQYEIQAMPTSFLFDRQGQLLGSHLGFKLEDAEELSAAIENLLKIAP